MSEMFNMMRCLEHNNFKNSFCAKEVEVYQTCMKSSQQGRKQRKEMDKKGSIETGSSNLSRTQLNILLKRYAQKNT